MLAVLATFYHSGKARFSTKLTFSFIQLKNIIVVTSLKIKLQKTYQDTPVLSNISGSLVNKAYEDIKDSENKTKEIYVELH